MNYHLIPEGNDWVVYNSTHILPEQPSYEYEYSLANAIYLAQRDKVILYVHDQTGRIIERKDYGVLK